jgi:hypothetical protein
MNRGISITALALLLSTGAFAQAPQTHWEPYKRVVRPPSVDQRLEDPVLAGAPDETLKILAEARNRGIARAIVTHPLLDPQFTIMSVPQLREAAALGAIIEITAGSLFRDGPGRARVLKAVRALGPRSFFVASDSGLVGTPNHADALVLAARVLRQNGFDEQALDTMFKHNPARLLGLPIL